MDKKVKGNKANYKPVIIGIIVLVVLAAAAGIFYGVYQSNDYVAKVGEEKITRAEFSFFLSVSKQDLVSKYGKDQDAKKFDWNSKISGEVASEVAVKNALESAKDIKLQLIKAVREKITLDEQELKKIDDNMSSFIESQTGKDNAEKRGNAEKSLKSEYGISLEEYKKIYTDYTLAQKYAGKKVSLETVPEEEIEKYYKDNIDEYTRVSVMQIIKSTIDPNTLQPLPKEKLDEAKKKAEEVFQAAKSGKDMKELFKQNSDDAKQNQDEGVTTIVKNDTNCPQQYRDWAFSAKVGDIGLISTNDGYYIAKLEKILTYMDLHTEVEFKIRQTKYADMMTKWRKDPQFNIEKNTKVLNSIKVS